MHMRIFSSDFPACFLQVNNAITVNHESQPCDLPHKVSAGACHEAREAVPLVLLIRQPGLTGTVANTPGTYHHFRSS